MPALIRSGFARGAVAFDVDPDKLHVGAIRNTHFEQVYQRAVKALQNAEVTFNRATDLTSELRKQQNSVSDYSVAVANQEIAYLEELLRYLRLSLRRRYRAGRHLSVRVSGARYHALDVRAHHGCHRQEHSQG